MCSPVLSLPRHSPALSMHETMAWRGQADQRFFLQHPVQSYASNLPGMMGAAPGSPAHLSGIQPMGAWDWNAGAAVAAPPILATSPKQNRKAGPTQRGSRQRGQAAAASASKGSGVGGAAHGSGRPAGDQCAQRQSPLEAVQQTLWSAVPDGLAVPVHAEAVESYFSWPATELVTQPPVPPAAELGPALELPKHCSTLNEETGELYGSESPVRIRNTFLDSPLERSPSLERFFEERKVRSCPASGPHSRQVSGRSTPHPACAEDPLLIATPSGSVVVTPRGSGANGGLLGGGRTSAQHPLPEAVAGNAAMKPCDLAVIAAAQLAEVAHGGVDSSSSTSSTTAGNLTCSGPVSEASGSGAIPLSQQPPAATDASSRTVGLTELPSKGSALHPWGACKPCAFVFEAGCANGSNCQFCHLCEPGEKKRRKKERRRMAKDAQN